MNTDDWQYVLSFFLGGSMGALRSWRTNEKITWREVFGSGINSGLVSVMLIAYMWDNGITKSMVICISIAAGIGADDIIRFVAWKFGKLRAHAEDPPK